MSFYVGCYVVHRKLSELGSGEVIGSEMGAIRIRFASGERLFSTALVGQHLEITREAPVMPPAPIKRKGAGKARKP